MTDKNIILVTVDSLRADHCGFMGYEKDITPTLDRMAEEGKVYENAISPGPRTPESMPVIFTGKFLPGEFSTAMVPERDRIVQHMQTHQTLPEIFSQQGYHTIGFSPNPFASRYFGFDKGFDHFQDFLNPEDTSIYSHLFEGWLEGSTMSNIMRLSRNMILREEVFKPWEAFYDQLKDSVKSADEPYFLWIFLMDVHEPYLAGSGYRSLSRWKRWKSIWKLYLGDRETPFSDSTKERLITAYDDSIRYTDAFLEQLLNDLGEESIVAVHGDHGEAFGEHGYYSHEPYLYEESIHVPLVVHGAEKGQIERPISLRELPSLLTEVSQGEESDKVGRDIIQARTSNQDTVALRTRATKYIDSDVGTELYRLESGEHTEADSDEARQLYSQLVTSRREDTKEQRRIRDAADELIGQKNTETTSHL